MGGAKNHGLRPPTVRAKPAGARLDTMTGRTEEGAIMNMDALINIVDIIDEYMYTYFHVFLLI